MPHAPLHAGTTRDYRAWAGFGGSGALGGPGLAYFLSHHHAEPHRLPRDRRVANARDILEAGFTTVRDLGHAGNYADTDLRRAIEEGLVPGPTILNSGKKICAYGGQFTLQPETREQVNSDYVFAESRDEMRKAFRSGATLAFGTDIAFRYRDQTHGQLALGFLETYVDAGMPAGDILKTMTASAARLLGVEKERGAIKPGQAADLVAVAGTHWRISRC